VHDVVGGKLLVKLETGEIVRFQKRDDLSIGDKVLVGYDFENMKHGHIIRDQHHLLNERHEPSAEMEPTAEDVSERMTEHQRQGVSLTDFEELGDFEALEVDDFEVLRCLSQGSEDVESSNGQ